MSYIEDPVIPSLILSLSSRNRVLRSFSVVRFNVTLIQLFSFKNLIQMICPKQRLSPFTIIWYSICPTSGIPMYSQSREASFLLVTMSLCLLVCARKCAKCIGIHSIVFWFYAVSSIPFRIPIPNTSTNAKENP